MIDPATEWFKMLKYMIMNIKQHMEKKQVIVRYVIIHGSEFCDSSFQELM